MKSIILHVCLTMLLCVTVVISGTTGKLAGRVTDRQTGEAIVGATVLVKGTSLGASTDIDGYYFIINVPPGNFEITINCIGYTRMTYRVSIQVDHTTTLDVPLSVETINLEEVVVEGERVMIQRDQSSTVQRTNAEELATLPVNTISGVLQL